MRLASSACLAMIATGSAFAQAPSCLRPDRTTTSSQDSLTPGTYRLTLVATEGTKRRSTVTGTLELRLTTDGDQSPRTKQRPTRGPADEPLYGWTDVNFHVVGAPVTADTLIPRPSSTDPVFPGVVVLRHGVHGDSFVLVVGSVTNRRADDMWLDGPGIFLSPQSFGDRVYGRWAEWGIVKNGRGFFCADRKR